MMLVVINSSRYMYLKFLSALFFIQVAVSLHAQNISYEKLDSISSEISRLQTGANGLTYNDGKTDCEISFSEENFKINFHDQLAYKAVYKKRDGKEILALNENVDLTMTKGVTWQKSYNNVAVIKLYFPDGYIKTQILEDGNLTNTISEDYLEFFTETEKKDLFLKNIFEACTIFKIVNGLTTEKAIAEEDNDWVALSEERFLQKHPNSLKAKQAKLIIKQKEEEEREKQIELEKEAMKYDLTFMHFYYKYKLGRSVDDSKKEHPELALKYVKNKTQTGVFDELISLKDNLKFYVKNDTVCGYFGEISKGSIKAGSSYGDGAEFIEGDKEIDELKKSLVKSFNFEPSMQKEGVDYSNGKKTSYSWVKNGKIVRLEIYYKENMGMMNAIFKYAISIYVMDKNLVK